LSVPTFAADGYVHNDNAVFVSYASKDLGPVHADWNVGLGALQLNGSPRVQEYTSLALSAALPANLGVDLEGYIFSKADPVAPHDGGLRAALTVAARPWLVFDAGGDVGFFPSVRGYSLFAGVTIIPVVFWRRAKAM
jgi:hypothetical protein